MIYRESVLVIYKSGAAASGEGAGSRREAAGKSGKSEDLLVAESAGARPR